jgi:hypothetical protein
MGRSGENRGIYAVLKVAPKLFDDPTKVVVNSDLQSRLEASEEFLIDAEKLTEPKYTILAPAK